MAISHICLQCGLDLAHRPARREPLYGLPLVQCPQCGARSVRRRHPLLAFWRGLLRLDAALTALVLQLIAVGAFAAGMTASAVGTGELLVMPWDDPDEARAALIALVLIAVLFPMANGAWLASGLAHWRLAWLWPAWIAVTLVVTTGACAVIGASEYHTDVWRSQFTGTSLELTRSEAVSMYFLWRWLRSVVILGALHGIALAGIPAGHFLNWLWGRVRAARWRWIRRRRRRSLIAG